MGRSDSPSPVSPHFVSFAWRYHPLRLCLLPAAKTRGRGHRGVGIRAPEPESGWRRLGLPGSRGPLVVIVRALGPRRDSIGVVGPSVAYRARPPRQMKTRAPNDDISGLDHTLFDLAVYASQGWSPTHHARLASGCWPGSAGRDWVPAGFRRKVLKFESPPFTSFPGATSAHLSFPVQP